MNGNSKVIPWIRSLVLRTLGLYVSRAQPLHKVNGILLKLLPRVTEHKLVRVGNPNGDGGYLVPESQINCVSHVFSPGVSDNFSFETYFANKGKKCFLIDGSVEASQVKTNDLIEFQQLWLSTYDSTNSVTLDTWIKSSVGESNDLLLQMDIEGAELQVIGLSKSEVLIRFRVIVLEIHELNSIFTSAGLKLFEIAIRKLTENHLPIHLHVNNAGASIALGGQHYPDTIEVTLIRKDLVATDRGVATIPNSLDRKNVEENRDLHFLGTKNKNL